MSDRMNFDCAMCGETQTKLLHAFSDIIKENKKLRDELDRVTEERDALSDRVERLRRSFTGHLIGDNHD
jgi:predicted  nucleic acid-binding Zn-ribbon protein